MSDAAKNIRKYRTQRRLTQEALAEKLHVTRQAGLECYEPRGAFYVFPCIRSTGLSSDEFCERFLMSQRVAVIPGGAFGPGGEGFVRMCYAAGMDDLQEALRRLDVFLKEL